MSMAVVAETITAIDNLLIDITSSASMPITSAHGLFETCRTNPIQARSSM
jgi:hypothetical protein